MADVAGPPPPPPSQPPPENSPNLSVASSRLAEQNETVRQNAQDSLSQYIYKFIFWVQFVTMLGFTIESVTVLILKWSEKCSQPLAKFLLVYAINTSFCFLCHVYFYKEQTTGMALLSETGLPRFMKGLKEFTDFLDRLIIFMGTIFITNCDDCKKNCPVLYGVTVQIIVYRLLVLFGPVILFIVLFCGLSTFLALFSRYQKWRNKVRFNEMIGGIPVYTYSTSSKNHLYGNVEILPANADCAVCLQAYEDGTEIRILTCNHHYHSECIDQWICLTPSCPLCKRPVFPERSRSGTASPGDNV